ncbi:MAG: cell division protein FtsQ/DivIB [Terriglobia bacterium]
MSERKPPRGDWDNDDAVRYHRPRRPVEVRRGTRWKRALRITARVVLVGAAAAALVEAGVLLHRFATTAAVFRVASLEGVEVAGAEHVTAATVREHFAADVGQSVFAIPLRVRRRSLEEIPWVEAAGVQRLLPNRLRVYLRERTPVAFLRRGHMLGLIDRYGVILSAPESASFSFPVLTGLGESVSPAERQARVGLYLDFVSDLDAGGKKHSAQLSEVDLSDPDNIRASVTDAEGAVWLYFGRGRYQEKFEAFLEHRSLWQRSGETVRTVDLRYRGQIVLNPGESSPRGSR